MNSYFISKHHSDLDCFFEYLRHLTEDSDTSEILRVMKEEYQDIYQDDIKLTVEMIKNAVHWVKSNLKSNTEEQNCYLYAYSRFLYSLLVACDYYATAEYKTNLEIKDFGDIKDIQEFYSVFNETDLVKQIRGITVPKSKINVLRRELFLETEKELQMQKEDIYFLEAPTGSGKSNTALNLSFKLLEENKDLNKIFYIYPFNTLVEQNRISLNKIFGNNEEVIQKIAVINSVTPMKMEQKAKLAVQEDDYEYYAKVLLNRQFLNYPLILTTHVSLFDTMFGHTKESAFAFHQLSGSVIVLDEIQSYKNLIWTEIIHFLKAFSRILNMKVIIMSATLPDFNLLTTKRDRVAFLVKDRKKYFLDPVFKNRVLPNYDLMDITSEEELYVHLKQNSLLKKKILVEFISKDRAYHFYYFLIRMGEVECPVKLMSGDDSSIERQNILKQISEKDAEQNGIILIATQVVEAGVDIDMDIGYKDISKLDSEEQFMGRINRSCLRTGAAYFFQLDRARDIYKNDFRMNKEFSLQSEEMKSVLENKEFSLFYNPVMNLLRKLNQAFSDKNIDEFFENTVGTLNFTEIGKRMLLIEENQWNISVYFNREIMDEHDEVIKGDVVWETYKQLLKDNKMDYAKKQVKLSEVTSKMSYFIYQLKKNSDLCYHDKIGELYYIENGEEYFTDGKLDKEKLEKHGCLLIDL